LTAEVAPSSEIYSLSLTVNGAECRINVEATRTLLSVLREDLGLTGTKRGCDQGVCGSCTVLCDGAPIRSCLSLAVAEVGKEIHTIEGLSADVASARVQNAFVEAGAVQCGFCIPGMVITAVAFLRSNPRPSRMQIREALSGNLCRCSGYVKIVDAIAQAGTEA
jgi:carbon-monoxide dehydrogenase small subunit